ncbi:MAG: DsbA family protein [Alphaproteobacteria bacterium]
MKTTIKNIKFKMLTLATCAAALCAPVGANAEEKSSFTPEQKTELEVLFKEFLANNPEAILKSVENHQIAQEQKERQSAEDSLKEYREYFAQPTLPAAGNPDGDVTVVEFFDYNCGYCRKAYEDLIKLIGEDKNLRVVFQDMPILSPTSKTMASLSMAAHQQGKYFEMHQALMAHRGPQSDEAFFKVSSDLGLDMDKLKEDALSDRTSKTILNMIDIGRKMGIRGTPGFIIGDKIYPGYIGLKGLRDAIAEARAAAKAKAE